MLKENKWRGSVCLAMLVCPCVFLKSQPLFAQANNTASQLLQDSQAEHDELQTEVAQVRGRPKPEHPYSSLTILISNGKLLRDEPKSFVPAARFENTRHVTYHLRADGTLCLTRNYPMLVRTVPADAIEKQVEAGGKFSDHCFIQLIAGPGVDFDVALKVAQAVEGVAEKYETFQFLIDLSKPVKADESNRKERKGAEEEKGP